MKKIYKSFAELRELMDDITDMIMPGPPLLNHDDAGSDAKERKEYDKLAAEDGASG
jgi:hypothetical protein